MAKVGVIHDYDLWANKERSAQGVTCAVCDTPNTRFQWSDYNGEAMCTTCGCPYQLMNGTDAQIAEGKYPYLSLLDTFVPVARKFWKEMRVWVHYGQSFSREDGFDVLNPWIEKHHPELIRSDERTQPTNRKGTDDDYQRRQGSGGR